MSWRVVFAAALLVASFAYVPLATAQADSAFDSWLAESERLKAITDAAEHGITVKEAAAARLAQRQRTEPGPDLADQFLFIPPEERRQTDLAEYERDKAEASKRGLPIETVLKERLEAEGIERAKEEELREQEFEARERREQLIQFSVLGAIALAVIAAGISAFTYRRWIVASASRRWRSKSKDFRLWVFGSFFWGLGTLLLYWFDPDNDAWGSYYDQHSRISGILIIPPLFLGALWFGYKRFVK